MYKPNTILNRFDCLLFDVKHESWGRVRRKNFRDRCVTTQILVSETQVFEIYKRYCPFKHHTSHT